MFERLVNMRVATGTSSHHHRPLKIITRLDGRLRRKMNEWSVANRCAVERGRGQPTSFLHEIRLSYLLCNKFKMVVPVGPSLLSSALIRGM